MDTSKREVIRHSLMRTLTDLRSLEAGASVPDSLATEAQMIAHLRAERRRLTDEIDRLDRRPTWPCGKRECVEHATGGDCRGNARLVTHPARR